MSKCLEFAPDGFGYGFGGSPRGTGGIDSPCGEKAKSRTEKEQGQGINESLVRVDSPRDGKHRPFHFKTGCTQSRHCFFRRRSIQSGPCLEGPKGGERASAQEEGEVIHVIVGPASEPVHEPGLGPVWTSQALARVAKVPSWISAFIGSLLDCPPILGDTHRSRPKKNREG